VTRLLVLVAVLLAGLFLGGWAALWWRDRVPFGQRQLVRRVYIHVDELLGSTRTENQLRAGKRFTVQRWLGRGTTRKGNKKLGTAIADWFWPMPPQAGGTTKRPSVKRMGQFVRLEFARPRTWTKPYRIWDIEAVVLHWTSEANALGAGFGDVLGRKVAQALLLKGVSQLDQEFHPEVGRIIYRRTKPAVPPPTGVPFEEVASE
jgi:hypothetical protein